MLQVTPSIASADPLAIRSELARLQSLGRLHLDIEDGNFIDNITFGKKTVCAIAQAFSGTLDVHLMTTQPESYLSWLAQAHIQAVCGHLEALPYPKRFLLQARKLGMKAGIALNLKTLPEVLLSYTDCLDYVLVMTSEPDSQGQVFFPQACSRVAAVKKLLSPGTKLWCDGGIQPEHLQPLYSAGMDVAIMGRAVFSAQNPVAAIQMYERSVISR